LQYEIIAMPQVININNSKTIKKLEIPTTKETSVKAKTKFQEEWEKGISADKAFDELLTYVRNLWKK
jgi:hypothetical protein